jgi:UDP-4-amino-4-deoxy-L-arabinose formyltransferase/UDP-glucuronic acid dehydrogenase (UDP-4-keto-hexauronic acid decarboxylating)
MFKARKAAIPNYQEPRIEGIDSEAFYGKGYQDISTRKPNVEKAKRILGWESKTTMDEALEVTMDAFFEEWNAEIAGK